MQFILRKNCNFKCYIVLFIIISKCYNKPNLTNLVRIDYFDKINFFGFLQVFSFLVG